MIEFVLLVLMVAFVMACGGCYYNRNRISHFVNNYYAIWENEIAEMKKTSGITNPPGVLGLKRSKQPCNTEIQMIQGNIPFKSERVGDSCTFIKNIWPGEMQSDPQ